VIQRSFLIACWESSDMAWRTGARLYHEIWPLVLARVEAGEFRDEFVRDLLTLFLDRDVDPADLVGLHPEVDRALQTTVEGDDEAGEWRPVEGEEGEWRPSQP
jgi:hypothetical protein